MRRRTPHSLLARLFVFLANAIVASSQTSDTPDLAAKYRTASAFEMNQGQEGSEVRYLLRSPDYTVFLTSQEAVIAGGNGALPSISVAGARPAEVQGTDDTRARANYFIGNDPSRWLRQIPIFSTLRYQGKVLVR